MNEKEWITPAFFINGKPVGDVQMMDFAGDDCEVKEIEKHEP